MLCMKCTTLIDSQGHHIIMTIYVHGKDEQIVSVATAVFFQEIAMLD